MNDTVITVLGNVGSDVRQVVTAKGAVLTSFRLASTPRSPDRDTGEWVDGTTTWYSVVAWRNLADNIASSLTKGDPVLVHGRLRTVSWERDGRAGETLEIEALAVGPDLNRGRATYRRVLRPTGDRATRSGAAEQAAGPDDEHVHPEHAGTEHARPEQAGPDATGGEAATSGEPVGDPVGNASGDTAHSAEPELAGATP